MTPAARNGVEINLVDGTYELFRQFFGQPSRKGSDGTEIAAARGVASSMVMMLEEGTTHLGVATDHVIESFRNEMWPGYKDSSGIDPDLLGQFTLLEDALSALGITVWPMTELEADDGLASAAAVAADDDTVDRVVICTPDKDLAQCVRGDRVVQLDRRSGKVSDAEGVHEKFGVAPQSIPDWLGLVGDSADGFPGLAGWGKRSAAVLLEHYEHFEAVPEDVEQWDPGVRSSLRGAAGLAARLVDERELAYLFRDLATLRVDRSLVRTVDDLKWRGPADGFEAMCERLQAPQLAKRTAKLADALG